jgi:hypothetical protein
MKKRLRTPPFMIIILDIETSLKGNSIHNIAMNVMYNAYLRLIDFPDGSTHSDISKNPKKFDLR